MSEIKYPGHYTGNKRTCDSFAAVLKKPRTTHNSIVISFYIFVKNVAYVTYTEKRV